MTGSLSFDRGTHEVFVREEVPLITSTYWSLICNQVSLLINTFYRYDESSMCISTIRITRSEILLSAILSSTCCNVLHN
jgi:hypothetical protein